MPKVQKQSREGNGVPAGGTGVMGRVRPIGFDPGEGLKLLLYGRSGTGKTTLWATFPKPILAVVCSGGKSPGELRSIDTPEYRKTISQVVLRESGELQEVVEAIEGGAKYATVVLDHASGLQDRVLAEILGMDELPAQKAWGLATQQQYGQCTLQCKGLLRSLLGIKANVVLVAQEREFNVEGDQSELLQPYVSASLTPSLAGWLAPACDYVVQTFLRAAREEATVTVAGKEVKRTVATGRVEYCLRTGPDPVYATKFRRPRGQDLPDVIVDPTYDDIARIIRGAATK